MHHSRQTLGSSALVRRSPVLRADDIVPYDRRETTWKNSAPTNAASVTPGVVRALSDTEPVSGHSYLLLHSGAVWQLAD